MSDKIYENENDSTAYYAVKDVTINNYSTDEKHLSLCQNCGVIRARAHADDDEYDTCSATPEGEGEHLWNHVNEVYVSIDHGVESVDIDDDDSAKEIRTWHKNSALIDERMNQVAGNA